MKTVLFMTLLFSTLVSLGAPAETTAYDFVKVVGEGEIKVKPDYVLLNATVYSRAMSAQQAQKDNAKEMARIDKVLKQDFKLDAKDLQTHSFQVTPQYDYQKDRPVYKGMSVTHTLTIKFRKVEEVGNLLDRLISGTNQEGFGVRIEDISFGTDQLKSYQLQALEGAMIDAKARAQVLAKAGGRNLLNVRKVSDTKISSPDFEPIRTMGKATFSSMSADAGPTQVAAGEISVRAQVQVEYDVK
jgi:uncharacterized protein YggE